ncbi:MAG TPA: oxygen-dependent coproporphyrinogen oxidase [Bacteroidia bacterium]|jgi:coproporphyrinogen III oxidase|nr:oxygen-dependent coproporphyrinogen oxidase [Bacteroidia bacterium]
MTDKKDIANYFRELQNNICAGLEKADGKARFQEDKWERPEGGGGKTRVIQNGNVFEKGGVNFSEVYGPCPDFLKKENGITGDNVEFIATGVSIVIHPFHPFVPIIHMNVRYFEAGNTWWFGGGIDLTPHYIDEEDARFFHTTLKQACDLHSSSYYGEFKKWADEYFYITHRGETRGVGGIFFDKLSDNEEFNLESRFAFVKSIGESFLKAYTPLVEKNKKKEFTADNRQWQLLRRGRYAEFNLVYDRGTKFGLHTNGRTESILMSLPPLARWDYCPQYPINSLEDRTLQILRQPNTWIV